MEELKKMCECDPELYGWILGIKARSFKALPDLFRNELERYVP